MTDDLSGAPSRRATRLAGLVYLGLIAFGILAQLIRSGIHVPGDAAATAQNLRAAGNLNGLSVFANLLMVTCYVLWGLGLYLLLRRVNKPVALFMTAINLVGAPIMALNLLGQVAAQRLLLGSDYLRVFSAEQLEALALFLFELENKGYLLGALSFGLYLLPLGYLLFKSGFFPKAFGILYILAGSVTLLDFAAQFLSPRLAVYTEYLLYPVALVEISFCLWLLLKGARELPLRR